MIRFLQTPGRLQKVLLIGFLAVVCIMMVVTLVPGGILTDLGGGSSLGADSVAKVDGVDVTNEEVDRVARSILQQRHIPAQFKSLIIPQAVDEVVLQKAYLAEAKRLGLRATDDQLRYEMQHGDLSRILYPNGNFIGTDQYRDLVANQFDLSVPQFEQALRDELTVRNLRTVLDAGVYVSDAEVHDAFVKQQTRVRFEYAVLTADELAKSVTLADSELHAYYEKNQQQFANTIPEQRKLKYVVIDPSRLPSPAKPTDAELESYYHQHVDEYRVPESVKFRHILIKLPLPGPDGKVDAKQAAAAKAKAEDVLNQLQKGGDFAALAKKYSDDTATAASGGVVGQLVRGSGSAPEIEKVAFSLAKGQVSGVIPTSYGFEIIRVDEKIPGHQRSFDEVRSEIQPIVARQLNQTVATRLASTVENQADSSTLEKAAAAHGLQVEESGFVTRNDSLPGIGSSPQFSSTVFGMKANAGPESVALAEGYAIVQVTAVKPPSTPGFEQVKDRIVIELKRQKAEAMLTQKLQELSQKARDSHDLKAAAKAVGATVNTSDLVTPDGQVPDLGQLSSNAPQIFDMKPGAISQPINLGQKGAVIELIDKVPPSDNQFDLMKNQIRQQVLERKRADAEEVFAVTLRERLIKRGRLLVDAKKEQELAGGSKP